MKAFLSGLNAGTPPNLYVHQQSERATQEGAAHGFRSISIEDVAGKPHGAMADEVLGRFQSLL